MAAGRALWVMLLVVAPLTGYSYAQAVALYAEASRAAAQFPELARGLSPLDGIVVPTLGAVYLGATFLFPFVAIRALGEEKTTGSVKLLVQLPYPTAVLIAAKLLAVMAAWLLLLLPGSRPWPSGASEAVLSPGPRPPTSRSDTGSTRSS